MKLRKSSKQKVRPRGALAKSLRTLKWSIIRLWRSKWLSSAIVILLLITAAGFVYTNNDIFFLRKIEVEGDLGVFVEPDDIKGAVQDELVRSTVKISTGRLRRLLLDEFESLDGLTVEKRFPDTLFIHADEKKAAIALQRDGVAHVSDSNGEYITKVQLPLKAKVPIAEILSNDETSKSDVADYLDSAPILLKMVSLDWWRLGLRVDKIKLDESSVYVDVVSIDDKDAYSFTVLFPRKDDVVSRFDKLRVVLSSEEVDVRKLAQVDLRFERVVIRER